MEARLLWPHIQLLWGYIQVIRPLNAVHPIIGVAVGYVLAGGTNNAGLLLSIVGMFIVHSAITVWNDAEDYVGDALAGRQFTSFWQQHLMHVRIGAATVCGLVVGVAVGQNILAAALFVLLICLGWLYNAKPFQASHRPVASIIVLYLSYGLVPVLIGAAFGTFSMFVLVVAGLWGLSRVSLSLLKDYKDAHADAKVGKKTFLLVYGSRRTAHASIVFAGVGMVGLLVALATYEPSYSLVFLLIVALAILYERTTLLGMKTYAQMTAVFEQAVWLQLVFELGILAWLRSL